MLIIRSDTDNPYFNIAAEEYLHSFNKDIFFLYRNSDSVIIGKHQNIYAEVNISFAENASVPVIRRMSGGGAVFHDKGNINFCFISNHDMRLQNYFRYYTGPVMRALQRLGLSPEYTNRNDLVINGRKFSGNAQHIGKNRIMHHGTVLFSSNLNKLNEVLISQLYGLKGNHIRSVRSDVVNISDLVDTKIEIVEEYITEEAEKLFSKNEKYFFSGKDRSEITKLINEKYSLWEWNWAYSPAYTLIKDFSNSIKAEITVRNGIISDFVVKYSDGVSNLTDGLSIVLKGVPYRKPDILIALRNINIGNYLPGLSNENFVKTII